MFHIGKQVSSVTTRPLQNRLSSLLKKVHTCTARGACMYFLGYKSVLSFFVWSQFTKLLPKVRGGARRAEGSVTMLFFVNESLHEWWLSPLQDS